MFVPRKLFFALVPMLLVACTSTDPNPAPRPEPPKFRRCQTCEGTNCVVVWIGQTHCKAESDEQGRSCTAHGACVIGTFGAVSVPLHGAGEPDGPDPLPEPTAEVLAVQARFNDLFQRTVVEKLGSCWADLEGQGAVTIEHEYLRGEDGDWVPHDLRVVHSTLPGEQREIVDKCMRGAVESVFLPYDPGDGEEQELLLIWTWAVPLPG